MELPISGYKMGNLVLNLDRLSRQLLARNISQNTETPFISAISISSCFLIEQDKKVGCER